ncbi:acylneuraminate cytidylyltransferase family protein [Methylophilaceae bacterium]|nr:acylneuraminate cytidylyltransferase family protein [Methylophilaceae bacterium]
MYKKNTFLAIIPARGGSKRLLNKNKKKFNDKPLINWSINAAKKSKYIDSIIVSSDDDEILSIAENQDVDILKRPSFLANDTSTTENTLIYTLEKIEDSFDFLLVLQPTSPLRTSLDIDQAIEMLMEKKGNSVVSVCKEKHSSFLYNTLPESGLMDNFNSESLRKKKEQDIEVNYRLNGAIYIVKISNFVLNKTLIPNKTYAYKMDITRSIDIDTMYDFVCAEAIMRSKKL